MECSSVGSRANKITRKGLLNIQILVSCSSNAEVQFLLVNFSNIWSRFNLILTDCLGLDLFIFSFFFFFPFPELVLECLNQKCSSLSYMKYFEVHVFIFTPSR